MHDVIFIGRRRDAAQYRAAGIASFAPAQQHLVERVLAERKRCRRLAMTPETFEALPPGLARELRASEWPRLVLVTADDRPGPARHLPPHLLPTAPLPPLMA